MYHKYSKRTYKEGAYILEITNCEECGIDISADFRYCDVCIENLNKKDLLKRQQNLWKRYIYYPWKRAILNSGSNRSQLL